MKKVLMIFALAAVTSAFAQENKNKKTETVVTKTAVKDSKGIDVSTKEVTQSQKQVIALEDSDANKTNQAVIMKPVEIDTDVNYSQGGTDYTFQSAPIGYKLMTTNAGAIKDFAIIRPSSQKGYYIIDQEGAGSFGYFNSDGDFVVERYDTTTDAVITTVYELKQKTPKMLKDKM